MTYTRLEMSKRKEGAVKSTALEMNNKEGEWEREEKLNIGCKRKKTPTLDELH